MSDGTDKPAYDGSRRVSGPWTVAFIFGGALLTVLVAFAVIKPPPGFKPAPEQDRPFGPATAQEVQEDDTPLIRRATGRDAKPSTRPVEVAQ